MSTTVNLKKVGSFIKAEVNNEPDIYDHPAQIKFIMPSDGEESVEIHYGFRIIKLNAITDISIEGVAVSDQEDFETKIAESFPEANSSSGGSATFQGVLDEGSTLDKDNEIDSDGNVFTIISGNAKFTVDATRSQISYEEGDNYSYVRPSNGVLDIVCGNATDEKIISLSPTEANLYTNGTPKPIATVNYKVYTALLSQSGTSAPTAEQTYEETISGISLSRLDVGEYQIAKTGNFDLAKTFIPIMGNNIGSFLSHATPAIPVFGEVNGLLGYYIIVGNSGSGTIKIKTFDLTFTQVEWSSINDGPGGKLFIPIDIKVYP